MSEKTDGTLAGIVTRLESLERVARNRGSLACDHLAEQAAGIRLDLEEFAAAAPDICSGHSAVGSGHMPTAAEGQPVAWLVRWQHGRKRLGITIADSVAAENYYHWRNGGENNQPVELLPLYTAPPITPVGVEGLVERMRQAPSRLWMADLVGQKISIERMRDILTFALAQQPAAVNEAMVERALQAWFETDDWVALLSGIEPAASSRSRMHAALTAALATQPGGSDNDR